MPGSFDEIVENVEEGNDRFLDTSDDVCRPDPVVIKGAGHATIFGLNNRFDDTFPAELKGRLAPEEFKITMNKVNGLVRKVVPLNFKWLLCGCLCCCCSFGCSFLPVVCLNKKAKNTLNKLLDWENSRLYQRLGLQWKLAKNQSMSTGMTEYVIQIEFVPKMSIYRPD